MTWPGRVGVGLDAPGRVGRFDPTDTTGVLPAAVGLRAEAPAVDTVGRDGGLDVDDLAELVDAELDSLNRRRPLGSG